ncbi:hypothetical protein CYV19_12245 [Natronobacterium gregoryi SP2]|uniref:Winged helix-turn-helix domain-containing protein n=1 Tax=Natronobacterium gregoryi (strain ATCC 43098 / DSM 3393 / CCM 3738 / CIP 104747 / IAM 13177 / JCM 8860 / NBRC 102187 / NCIMB 2189 / SP2) TaxID=797304 RepID=A0A2J4JDI9_NATGS|nr:hypothetical protein CYV19_12245 [Natronobacterium gregoryi SP2]
MNRKPARWMCTLDERILEHLAEDTWSTPRHISRTIKFHATRRRIKERCQLLVQVGLIAPVVEDSNMYEITHQGEEYLEGELDVENHPKPSVGVPHN